MGEKLEWAELVDLLSEPHCHLAGVTLDRRVATESQAKEVVVLRDYLCPWPRKVEREGRHVVAEVVDPEDQFVGERVGVAPHDPANTRVNEPVLVARRVDRRHPRLPEVPFQVRIDERRDERT